MCKARGGWMRLLEWGKGQQACIAPGNKAIYVLDNRALRDESRRCAFIRVGSVAVLSACVMVAQGYRQSSLSKCAVIHVRACPD